MSVVVGVLVHHIVAGDQLDSARRALDDRLLSAAAEYAVGGKHGGRLDPPDLPGPVADAVRAGHRVTYLQDPEGDHPVLWAAGRVSDRNVLAVSRSYRPEAGALAALDRALWAAGALATVAASAGGLLLGARMGRRATAAAVMAERIADGDLGARVAPAGRDEIARLATSVDAMADALGARLEAERRVTADIAHELRSPVAGMLTAISLLPPGQATDLVRDGAHTLHRLVEDVLEVARLDARVTRVDVEARQVSALARRAAEGLAGVSVRIGRDDVVETDPRRVERILANLAANAVKHGAGPVTVEVEGVVVRVRDRGPGFPEDLLAVLRTSGPQRFRTGARTGTGLGLTIAVGQARLLGARLTFGNRPEGGAEVVLELPRQIP
ncbi:sensor histidine kinase [Streptomyces sp. MMG1533]|uniref:sensor histidine kinase n=1 Tax=Streptomyces sp. MMG1533 TaxID=1415546 RepID=UPI001F3F83DF|nr:HAMP domain-containing sensor histidine kinase [Streptomyces sp. MMG1533]